VTGPTDDTLDRIARELVDQVVESSAPPPYDVPI
jgi:hypothetical protein